MFLPLTFTSTGFPAASAGSSTFHFPCSSAVALDSLFPIETVTFSPASAVPQTRTGRSRCSTIWFPKIRGKRTSAAHRDTAAVNDRVSATARSGSLDENAVMVSPRSGLGGKWRSSGSLSYWKCTRISLSANERNPEFAVSAFPHPSPRTPRPFSCCLFAVCQFGYISPAVVAAGRKASPAANRGAGVRPWFHG